MRLFIAIDGPAGSGKSTVARTVAEALGLAYIDTGAMYRALALKAMDQGVLDDLDSVSGLLASTEILTDGSSVICDGRDVSTLIRSTEVGEAASKVARVPAVREWMVMRQRSAATDHPEGAVVEGRDIGTAVLPDAQVKIYLDADPIQRAKRRAAEHGDDSEEGVRNAIGSVAERDARDMERKLNPLAVAPDAFVIDTTQMSIEQVVDMILSKVRET